MLHIFGWIAYTQALSSIVLLLLFLLVFFCTVIVGCLSILCMQRQLSIGWLAIYISRGLALLSFGAFREWNGVAGMRNSWLLHHVRMFYSIFFVLFIYWVHSLTEHYVFHIFILANRFVWFTFNKSISYFTLAKTDGGKWHLFGH